MRIIIAGGGASGLFAAYQLALKRNKRFSKEQRKEITITVLDAEAQFGKKILATGNGRCNLGNRNIDISKYYCTTPDFVAGILSCFDVNDLIKEFEDMGVVLKDKDGYLYPRSMQAVTIQSALISACRLAGVQLIENCLIEKIEKNHLFKVITPKQTYEAEIVLLAYGSNAGLKTQYTGPLLQSAKQLGHKIRPLLPALCSVYVNTSQPAYHAFFKTAAGVRTEIVVRAEGKDAHGELQLTAYGLSGIVIFQLSHLISRKLYKHPGKNVCLEIDFFDHYTVPEIIASMQAQYCYEKRTVSDLLSGWINPKLALALLQLYAALKDSTVRPHHKDLSKETLTDLLTFFKQVPFPVTATSDLSHSQVCCGGVDTSQITSGLESKVTENLFFCGECIDVDGLCGGYNLMWAWGTGYKAAETIFKKVEKVK